MLDEHIHDLKEQQHEKTTDNGDNDDDGKDTKKKSYTHPDYFLS